MTTSGVGGSNFPEQYLAEIKNTLQNNDKQYGNGDGQLDINEAYSSLDVASLLANQNSADAEKIKTSSADIQDVLKKYAGKDGVFSAQEWAEFLNGEEWGAVLKAWHSSSGKAKLEMAWIDQANSTKDGKVAQGEITSSLINNLIAQGKKLENLDNEKTFLADIVAKYAGADGVFTLEEYQALKADKDYQEFVNKNHIVPWFKFATPENVKKTETKSETDKTSKLKTKSESTQAVSSTQGEVNSEQKVADKNANTIKKTE